MSNEQLAESNGRKRNVLATNADSLQKHCSLLIAHCSFSIPLLPIFILFIVFALVSPAFAQSGGGENLTIKVAVMGPGTELYFWWGHIALVIEDSDTGQSRFYDYGLFSFDSENFFLNFAFGRLLYSCGASPANANIANYIVLNRDVTLFTLDLPSEKRERVREFAETNVLPENRDYYYHHFRDNCCTRIRDIIDLATDGRFREEYGDAPGRFTLRQHVRRHSWFSPVSDWALNFWMGQDIDKPTTVWEEMFLPSEVGRRIAEFSYNDSDGVSRQLVSDIVIVNRAIGRPAVLDIPRKQWPRELAFGAALMLLICVFYFVQAKKPGLGQILVGLSQSFAGLFFGIAALLLFFMSCFTNHDYTYHNMNLIFANPLLLAAVPLGILYAKAPNARARELPELLLRLLWLMVLLGIIVSMLLKLLPWFFQANLVDQMLMLPIAAAFALEPLGLAEIVKRTFWRWF
jgi:hypothetical protein